MTALTLYPAIDLKGGKCVRLLHGDMDKATIYADDPAAQAAAFEQAGFHWLHMVDLDGAFAGNPENRESVMAILSATRLYTQLGGGIRNRAGIDAWLEAGLSRVILGTAAVKDPALVRDAAKACPGQIAVGIDAKNGMVATEGWDDVSGHTVLDIARRFEDAGVAAIIFTDIGRDGALTGVNEEATAALARALSIPVIASGGVAGMADIQALKPLPVEGVIIGRALYDGRLDPSEALAAAERNDA